MYTHCPQCKTVHNISAPLLSHARGLVQCSECKRTFSALSFLWDEWPAGKPHGHATGADAVPPMLGRPSKKPEEKDASDLEPIEQANSLSFMGLDAMKAVAVLLLVLTIANAAWAFREPLKQMPMVAAWFSPTDDPQADQGGLLKDPGKIQLVSRDMHTHPTRSGILVLSLTFVNLAETKQAFPEMEITLLDATNQQVARRRFQATDYLREGSDIQSGLATDVYLPVLLELGDPGEQAVGFEISFF